MPKFFNASIRDQNMIIFIDGTMVLLERYYFNDEQHFMEKLGQRRN
jgi:hypothetical protein